MSKFLIAEDELIVAMDIKGRLEDLGYHVTAVAVTGQEAIDETQQHQPDLGYDDAHDHGEYADGHEYDRKHHVNEYARDVFLNAA